jgi:hypothetical protein
MHDSLAVIAYLPEGSFALHPQDSLRLGEYSLASKTLLLDGNSKNDFTAVNEGEYGSFFAGNISVARSDSTYIFMDVDSAGVSDSSGAIVIKIAVDTVVSGADLHLVGILTQDSVRTARFGNSGIYFNSIARGFVTDYNGTSFAVARGDTLYDTLRFTNQGWTKHLLGAAMFVMDASSKKVLQACNLRRFPVVGK